jgi:hypothetical protein
VLLTPDKMTAMRGKIDFLHRMKIAMIEEAFQLTSTNILYVDSDTFFIADPSALLRLVSEKKTFMHKNEYRFDSLRDMRLPAAESFHAFLDLIEARTFLGANGSPLPVSTLQYSWNAGAMILHKSHATLLPDIYALTDQFYPPTLNHASEQYAFSIILQTHSEIDSCEDIVYHYWYRVKKTIMDTWLSNTLTTDWIKLPLEKKFESVRNWVFILPDYLENHILSLHDRAIQAFHDNQFRIGWSYAIRTLLRDPSAIHWRDLLYHLRRNLRYLIEKK